jgi:hypothetical protein
LGLELLESPEELVLEHLVFDVKSFLCEGIRAEVTFYLHGHLLNRGHRGLTIAIYQVPHGPLVSVDLGEVLFQEQVV